MRSFAAILFASLACLGAQALSSPLIPAYVNAETGEVLVRVRRQAEEFIPRAMQKQGQEFLPRAMMQKATRRQDQDVAADTSYAASKHPFGRQKTQVYRGPNQPVKGGYEYFAPWGYYNTQPADLPPYH